MERCAAQQPSKLGIDETAFQKRHEYVTVMNDLERGVVIDVLADRKQETFENGLKSLGREVLEELEVVTLDMWQPYIAAITKVVPDAPAKIAFDRFHVAKHIGDAVNRVRLLEHRRFTAQGESPLTRSKFLWLQRAETLAVDDKTRLEQLCRAATQTARAWGLKELAVTLWRYRSKGWAQRAWLAWYAKAIRSRLEPFKKVARMIKSHLNGIVNATVNGVTNARSEGINARIQWLKKSACGFRNRSRFRHAILFHLGGLDLYPMQVNRA